ncbi:MAG TPA: hypothetical protein VHS58_18220, partial [Acetobacteraceae bacterium]|nr:hypothetical protein [Acetobacteraceae bacterium]
MRNNLPVKGNRRSGPEWLGEDGAPAAAIEAKPIRRRRLLTALAEAECCLLTLICAPAGAGKTTLALEWMEQLRASGNVVSRVTLSADDNEPVRFVTRLTRALQTAVPETAPALIAIT